MSAEAKRALVTGATRGIGRAIAERLVAEGRTVIACGRDARALDALVAAHPAVIPLAIDLAERGAPERCVDEALRTGPLDELVCAAGVVHYASIGRVSERELREQLDVNLIAPFLMAQRAGVAMQARGRGAVLFVSSTLADHPAERTAAYAASKAALASATRAFALELAPAVRVNALAPGVVDTDMVRVPRERAYESAAERERLVAEQLEALRALHPLARLGKPSDLADAALFLLNAPWITGTVVTIDGGLSLR